MVGNWEILRINLITQDNRGKKIEIEGVVAKRNKETGKIRVNPDEVEKASHIQLAKQLGLEPRDLLLLLMVNAKPGAFQRGYVCQKYKLNKMLFYQWKDLEKIGLGDSIVRDEFEAQRRGPVPKNLWDDLERLDKKGILKVDGGIKEKKTVTIELSKQGKTLADAIWNNVSDPYLTITTSVKVRLFPLTPDTIKDQVHKDYPEFRKTFMESDTEEYLKFKQTPMATM